MVVNSFVPSMPGSLTSSSARLKNLVFDLWPLVRFSQCLSCIQFCNNLYVSRFFDLRQNPP